jgi:kynurenine formamidase
MCLPGTVEEVRAACDHHSTPHHVSRRVALAGGGAAALIGFLPTPAAEAADKAHRRGRLQDLTHTFTDHFPVGTSTSPTRYTEFTIDRDGFYAQRWSFWEHTATHLDAPGHFIPGGRLTPQLHPEELMFVPAEVIDITARAAKNPDAKVEVRDIRAHEHRHGRIPPRALVMMNSGWAGKVADPDAFKGVDAAGGFHFPGFSAQATEFLLERRQISGVGVDTLSIDGAVNPGAPVHHMVLGSDLYALENLAHLSRIPATGSQLFIGIVPWEAGSGGPCRVIAHF